MDRQEFMSKRSGENQPKMGQSERETGCFTSQILDTSNNVVNKKIESQQNCMHTITQAYSHLLPERLRFWIASVAFLEGDLPVPPEIPGTFCWD